MKHQEIIEKVLREKLDGAEMEPPAAMFDRIAAQIDKPMVLAWYRRRAVLRAAAAFALLAVSAGLLLNNWPVLENDMRSAPELASYDSLQQERVDNQLESLKLAAAAVQTEENAGSENKSSSTMQPVVQTMRLASVTKSNQDTMERSAENNAEVLTAMETLAVKSLQRMGVKFQNPKKVQVPALEQQYASADESGILPALSKSYSLLSDGGLFDLAKERFDDFKTKEHYVSFNLGSLEIGQTFQLSRPENNETIEKE